MTTASRTDQPGRTYESFYRESVVPLRRHVARRAHDVDVEDVVQEALAKAWLHWPTVRAYDEPRAWLYRTVDRMLIDQRRRRATAKRMRSRLVDGDTGRLVEDTSVATIDVVAQLRELSPAHREVLALHYLLDLDVRTMAGRLGLSEPAVKSRLMTARHRLALQLGGDRRAGTQAPRARAA